MELKLCIMLAIMMFTLVLIVVGMSIFMVNKIENICMKKMNDEEEVIKE